MAITAAEVKRLAHEAGFELAGVARAEALPEADFYGQWIAAGRAGCMSYLEGRRAWVRGDPRRLLPSARSILCVAKLYNTAFPNAAGAGRGWISRYAWGDDYHDVLRRGLERVVGALKRAASFEHRIAVDTAPLLERALARRAGLGWIGKNTCLIREGMGSWFVLGELLLSLDLEPDAPPPDRCGRCRRCIDACPTGAIVRGGGPGYSVDSRRCISYFTIELKGPIPGEWSAALGNNVFGCDICQDVCPWNRKAPVTAEPAFAPREFAPPLAELAALSEEEFRQRFRASAVERAGQGGLLRNVRAVMGARS